MEELEAKADELKDPEQQFQVGRRYHNGLHCPQNIPRAIEWYLLVFFMFKKKKKLLLVLDLHHVFLSS
jgi:hypothetical protein